MPEKIREFRYRASATLSTTHTNAASATWAVTDAIKLGVTKCDLSKLKHDGIESAVLQTRMHGAPAVKPGLKNSPITIGGYLGKGSTSNTAPAEATLLSYFFGGLSSPVDKSETCGNSCTTDEIYCAGHSARAGACVLVGARGDGRGNGEVRRVKSVTNIDHFVLEMGLSGAPSNTDAIVHSHTVYLNPSATQQYIDWLAIGYHTEDQVQGIGAMGPVKIAGLGVGEIPQYEIDLNTADWQQVPAANRDQLESGVSPVGDAAPANKALGGFFFGDSASNTRTVVQSGNFNIDPGLTFEAIPDRNGVNGIGGWKKTGGKPKFDFDVLIDHDNPGLFDDFEAGTAKQFLAQFGHSANDCVAITIPNALLDAAPVRTSINGLAAMKITGHGQEPAVANVPDNVYSSSIAIHWF